MGEVLMSSESEIKLKRFERGDRLHIQAQQIWLILVGFVMNSKKRIFEMNGKRSPSEGYDYITYGELAILMGHSDKRAGHTLGRQLGMIGKLCILNNLPALNSIVVNQNTEMPGDEVILTEGRSIIEEQNAVLSENWLEIRVPTTGTFRRTWELMSQPSKLIVITPNLTDTELNLLCHSNVVLAGCDMKIFQDGNRINPTTLEFDISHVEGLDAIEKHINATVQSFGYKAKLQLIYK